MCYQSHGQDVDISLGNVLVIIPVRNEESTIAAVIKDLQSFGLTKIWVVDNGSSDRIREVAKDAGSEVLFESRAGYGQACWYGLQNIPWEIDWILFCDGDGSDDLSCLPQFFGLQKQYDLILGDRRATAEGKAVMTLTQHFGNSLASWLINFGWGIAVMGLGFIFSWKLKSLSLSWFWFVAIATRLILLAMYPGDDIWLYIWEGYIQNQGFSPYDFALNAPELIPYHFQWWSQINHQSISAIYPPLTQLGVRGLAAISPSVILFKSSFAIAIGI